MKRERASLRSANIELTNKIYSLEQRIRQLCSELDKERREKESLKSNLEMKKTPRSISQSRFDSRSGYVNPTFEFERSNESFTSLPQPHNIKSEFPSFQSNDRRLSSASMMSVRSNGSSNSARFKAVPDGSGRYFSCADEEDLEFVMMDKKPFDFHIETEKHSRGRANHRASDMNTVLGENAFDRISEIQRRNTLLPNHMRSCYPNEEFGTTRAPVPVDENVLRALPGVRARAGNSQQNHNNMPKSISGPSVGMTNRGYEAFTIPLDPRKKSSSVSQV